MIAFHKKEAKLALRRSLPTEISDCDINQLLCFELRKFYDENTHFVLGQVREFSLRRYFKLLFLV